MSWSGLPNSHGLQGRLDCWVSATMLGASGESPQDNQRVLRASFHGKGCLTTIGIDVDTEEFCRTRSLASGGIDRWVKRLSKYVTD